MPDTFLNNQEVTAEDLNNIAVDLGYADYSHFPETPPQSAVSALNQITADLTGAGILQIGNKCSVSIADNTIVVQDGVCVFENGAKKRIEGTLSIEFIEGGTNYVYLFNDVAGNKIELVNSLTEPTSGDFVMLAMVTKNKVVHNRRTFSRSKVNSLGLGATEMASFAQVHINYPEDSKRYICSQTQDVDLTKYNYAIVYKIPDSGSKLDKGFGVFDLAEGNFLVRTSATSSYCYYKGSGGTPWDSSDTMEIIDGNLCIVTSTDNTYTYDKLKGVNPAYYVTIEFV